MEPPRGGNARLRWDDEFPPSLAEFTVVEPDLEFDGRNARPTPGSVYGVVKRDATQGVVQIKLNRKA